jgi:hypothetical protein
LGGPYGRHVPARPAADYRHIELPFGHISPEIKKGLYIPLKSKKSGELAKFNLKIYEFTGEIPTAGDHGADDIGDDTGGNCVLHFRSEFVIITRIPERT